MTPPAGPPRTPVDDHDEQVRLRCADVRRWRRPGAALLVFLARLPAGPVLGAAG